MNKNLPAGEVLMIRSLLTYLHVSLRVCMCLTICPSSPQSASLTDVVSLCMLSCLSVRQTALNYSLQPLRELSITSF